MALHFIEVNDAGLIVGTEERILFESPGYILLKGQDAEVGERAMQKSRLDPRNTHNRFWSRLSLDALTQATPRYRHQADLAYAHLSDIVSAIATTGGEGKDEFILAVPGSFSKEQLSLLLGIAREVPMNVVGLVDTVVAGCAGLAPLRHRLCLDIELHQAVVTRLETSDKVQRKEVVRVADTGLAVLRDQWLQLVADLFVSQCRFDPLHDAHTEQALFDLLPDWLSAAAAQEEVVLEIESSGKRFQARLAQQKLLKAAMPYYEKIRSALRDISGPGGYGMVLTHRAAHLPGIASVVGDFETLDAGAAILGARNHQQDIRSAGEQLSFITALPVANPIGDSSKADAKKNELGSSPPTHLLHGSKAYSLHSPLYLGADSEGLFRLYRDSHKLEQLLASVVPGLQGIELKSHNGGEIKCNALPVSQARPLKMGDRISCDSPQFALTAIRVMDDGT